MIYLLDANVLIEAARDYYPINAVPEFWDWFVHHGNQNNVKLCTEIHEEITAGSGPLTTWVTQDYVEEALLLNEESDPMVVSWVVDGGYADDLTDIEIEQIGRDPFLIAYALTDVDNRCVVTRETSAPTKRRQNRRIPDVCQTFDVKCCDPFKCFRTLGFRTNWRTGVVHS